MGHFHHRRGEVSGGTYPQCSCSTENRWCTTWFQCFPADGGPHSFSCFKDLNSGLYSLLLLIRKKWQKLVGLTGEKPSHNCPLSILCVLATSHQPLCGHCVLPSGSSCRWKDAPFTLCSVSVFDSTKYIRPAEQIPLLASAIHPRLLSVWLARPVSSLLAFLSFFLSVL